MRRPGPDRRRRHSRHRRRGPGRWPLTRAAAAWRAGAAAMQSTRRRGRTGPAPKKRHWGQGRRGRPSPRTGRGQCPRASRRRGGGAEVARGQIAPSRRCGSRRRTARGPPQAGALRRIGELWGDAAGGVGAAVRPGCWCAVWDQALGVEAPRTDLARRRAAAFRQCASACPEPIGLEGPTFPRRARPACCRRWCDKLRARARGSARRLRLGDDPRRGGTEAGGDRPARPADRLRKPAPAVRAEAGDVDAGVGFERAAALVATVTRCPLHERRANKGGWAVSEEAARPTRSAEAGPTIWWREIGAAGGAGGGSPAKYLPIAIIPRKKEPSRPRPPPNTAPAPDWPVPTRPRPLVLFPPRTGHRPAKPPPCPKAIRWRGRCTGPRPAQGPERDRAGMWLDDPNCARACATLAAWRRWRAAGCGCSNAHGGAISGGWYAQGDCRIAP